MTPDRISAEHHAIARRMAARGFRVIIGYNKGGFWVRSPDMTKPPFADEHSFISFRKAKVLFTNDRRFLMTDADELLSPSSTCSTTDGVKIMCDDMEYDDDMDDDFEPLPIVGAIDAAFPLGDVLIEAATAHEVRPDYVQECLRRHASGDWGDVEEIVKRGNAGTLRGDHTMPIVSRFRVGARPLQITTKADGSVTSIILYEASCQPAREA